MISKTSHLKVRLFFDPRGSNFCSTVIVLGAQDITPDDNLPVGRNVLRLADIQASKNFTCVAASDLGNIEFVTQVKVKGQQGRVSNDDKKRVHPR